MPTGMATAYDLTVGVVVNMDELIYMVSPQDSPLLTGANADGLSLIGSSPIDEIKIEWLHEEILTPRSLLSVNTVTADTYITVGVGDQTKFSTGDIVRLVKSGGSEYVRVTGYGTTADTLTVTRGWDSTTATTFATSDKAVGVGTALAEGADPENARTKDRDNYSNWTQIFGPTSVHMSRTEQKVRKYGVGDEFSHQLMNRISENTINREQAYLYGRKYNSTTQKIRTTGGILQFISSNVDTTSTQLTELKIQAAQQLIYNKGGNAETIMANPAALLDLNDIANTSKVRVTDVDTLRGRKAVMTLDTEFGQLTIARNRWLEPSDAILFKRGNVTRRVIDPLQAERLAKTGDADKVQIVAEDGLEVKGQQHMARFSGLSYTAAY